MVSWLVLVDLYVVSWLVLVDLYVVLWLVLVDLYVVLWLVLIRSLWSLCYRLLAEGGRQGNKLAVVLCRSGLVSPYSRLRAAKGSAGHASVLPKAASRTRLTNTHDKRRIMPDDDDELMFNVLRCHLTY